MSFHYDEEQDERALKSKDFDRKMGESKVSSTIQFVNVMRYAKLIWLFLILIAYFFEWKYLLELLFFGVILSFLAQSFLTAHLEALIDLRSTEIDRNLFSVIANANKEFAKLHRKTKKHKTQDEI